MAVAKSVIDYIASLELVGGDHDGEPFNVLPWEARFIRGAWRQPGDAALSVGRGNGKSALVAAIATAVVDPAGPLHGRRREVVCVAASFEQSRIIYEDVLSFLAGKYDLRSRRTWRKQDTTNRAMIEHKPSGARVRCIGSNPGSSHGLRPALVLADEPAQWPQNVADKLLQALRTGLGKVPGSRLIALGTRSSNPSHWFSRMLVSAPYSQTHAARKGDPDFWMRTLKRANPSWDHLPSLRARIRAEIIEAKHDPDSLASFRALRLNQGVSEVESRVLLTVEEYERACSLAPRDSSKHYVLGLDLGTSAAMSAAAAYFQSGELDTLAVFPELPSLAERGLRDGVGNRYQLMHSRGELIQAGRRVSDIRSLLDACLVRWGHPMALVVDRWRVDELRDVLEAMGFPMAPLIVRGQGYKDGGEDVRSFRRAVLGGHVRPNKSLLLASAISESRTISDPAGNEKLSKSLQGGRRLRARDDAAAAAILAVSTGYRRWHTGARTERTGGAYLGVV